MNYEKEIELLSIIPEMIASKAFYQALDELKITFPSREHEEQVREIVCNWLVRKFKCHYKEEGEGGEAFRKGCEHGTPATRRDPRQYVGSFMVHWSTPILKNKLYFTPKAA